jgi:phosphate transport system substrate-binding protein
MPVIHVYASSATQPWLVEMFDCAARFNIVLVVDNPGDADVSLRIGEPDDLTSPAFQIDSDKMLVVTHPQAGVDELSLEQVRAIFSGQISNWSEAGGNDLPIEVWIFAHGEDTRQVFDQTVLNGLHVIPNAKLATSTQQMSDSVGTTPGAIGILPRRWKMGNTHETFTAATVPVLAITRSEPQDDLKKILTCLQK